MKKSLPRLLAAQTFIVNDVNTYHDYRDYIFSLVSSEFLKNTPVRLNIEKGGEHAPEIIEASRAAGFTDIQITTSRPSSWASYIDSHIEETGASWVMLFPGDHIFVGDSGYLNTCLDAAEELGVDAVSYGHVQDWEFLVDWERVPVLANTEDYIVIEWGWKWHYARSVLGSDVSLILGMQVVINPVPGYMIFRSGFLRDLLSVIPRSDRWHHIEFARHPHADSYKVLIPKRYLYRHVHGYWIEQYFDRKNGKNVPVESKAALDRMYIRPRYDWRTKHPTPAEYNERALAQYPYYERYFHGNTPRIEEVFWLNAVPERTLARRVKNFFLNRRDVLRGYISRLRSQNK